MAAFRGMHVSPAKHSFWKVWQTDGQIDRQRTKWSPMCRYASQATQKLENICSIYIWRSNGVKVCTGVLHYLAKYISYDFWFTMSKLNMFGENNQILSKNRKNLEKNRRICICLCIRVKVCTVVVHKFSKDIIYDFKLDWPKIFQFLAKYSNLGQNNQILCIKYKK